MFTAMHSSLDLIDEIGLCFYLVSLVRLGGRLSGYAAGSEEIATLPDVESVTSVVSVGFFSSGEARNFRRSVR